MRTVRLEFAPLAHGDGSFAQTTFDLDVFREDTAYLWKIETGFDGGSKGLHCYILDDTWMVGLVNPIGKSSFDELFDFE